MILPTIGGDLERGIPARREVWHGTSRCTYGAPRVHAELCAQGAGWGLNTVAKLMRQAKILPKAIRRFQVMTDFTNTTVAAPNLVSREFHTARPDAFWLSDIIYIPTR